MFTLDQRQLLEKFYLKLEYNLSSKPLYAKFKSHLQIQTFFDVARFIISCADAEIRRACERQVIDYYYDYLTKKYKEHGKVPKFTRKQAHELYELAFVQETLLFGIMVITRTMFWLLNSYSVWLDWNTAQRLQRQS